MKRTRSTRLRLAVGLAALAAGVAVAAAAAAPVRSAGRPSITVTRPNGGDHWTAGARETVRWSSRGLPRGARVTISLSRDGGAGWTSLARATPNSGRFTWTVSGPATAQALMRVSALGRLKVADSSDVGFAIVAGAATELWVDPVQGGDDALGTSRASALRTLGAAWGRVPAGGTLAGEYRIELLPGRYGADGATGWMDGRHGTADAPLVIAAADGPGTVTLPDLNIHDCSYLRLLDLDLQSGGTAETGGGNTLHFEACDHVLVSGCRITGLGDREAYTTPQETLKANQCSYLTVRDCDISGAWNPAVDFVAVQHGAILRNHIHRAGDWGVYVKGGSAYLTIEGNEIYDCFNGGFSAGQGTGFEYMVSPWLHYEATDIKFVNNLVHDTEGAGMGVNGGYNILLAWNTLYRVGSRSHALEIVQGSRGCDGDAARCRAYLAVGGWGSTATGDAGVRPIPNRNVYVFDNLLYDPDGYRSAWSHFALAGPLPAAAGSNIPSPARADDHVVIRGNLLWNGPADLALGIGEEGSGGQPGNPTCTAALVLAQNAVNTVRPRLRDPEHGDYRLAPGLDLTGAGTVAIPAFPGGDRPQPPLAPEGDLDNTITIDFAGSPRAAGDPPGAWR